MITIRHNSYLLHACMDFGKVNDINITTYNNIRMAIVRIFRKIITILFYRSLHAFKNNSYTLKVLKYRILVCTYVAKYVCIIMYVYACMWQCDIHRTIIGSYIVVPISAHFGVVLLLQLQRFSPL